MLRRFGAVEVPLIFSEFEAWDGPVGHVLASGRTVAKVGFLDGGGRGGGDMLDCIYVC